MIIITIKKSNNVVNNITISGHANYDDLGKDIVCASVSSILTTTVNACLKLDCNSLTYNNKNDVFDIKITKNDLVTDTLISNMIEMFRDLEKQYKKNIKIK